MTHVVCIGVLESVGDILDMCTRVGPGYWFSEVADRGVSLKVTFGLAAKHHGSKHCSEGAVSLSSEIGNSIRSSRRFTLGLGLVGAKSVESGVVTAEAPHTD